MSDIQLLWGCTTTRSPLKGSRETRSTGHKKILYQISDFWKQNSGCNAASCNAAKKRQPERYAFPSAANSRNKILAINVAVDPTSCLLLLSYAVLTVTKPARDALYKPVTVWPLSSAVIWFQRISSTMPKINRSRARDCYPKLIFFRTVAVGQQRTHPSLVLIQAASKGGT
jgi:hypothetical protein